jgi:hypothetical protein
MIRSYKIFLGLAACLAWAALPLAAQDSPRVELIHGHLLGATPPMREYVATHRVKPNPPMRVFPLRKPGSHPGKGGGNGNGGGGSSWSDSVLQSGSSLTSSTTQGTVIDGIASAGYVPPDTNISVGNGQIVETVNVDYAVYSTSGSTLQGPTAIHAIFAAAGTLANNDMCTSVDGGDPIVLYDKVHSRWIISQLAFNSSFSNNHLCLAISHSSDATGSYSAYDFSFGNSLPDYPKLGIWAPGSGTTFGGDSSHAGVYFSANIFAHGNRFTGAEMCAFPLSAVTAQPSSLTMVCAQNGTSVYSILPADMGGAPGVSGTTSPAPSGTAEYYLQFSGSNTLNLYQFTPDFGNSTATVSGPASITVAGFHEACGGGTCVPQANTSQQLDSLGDRLMYRLSYRNYAGTQSMVVTQSVQDDSSSNQTGVRWYQLKNTGSGWTVGQQGTFASTDGAYYWMGSIGQDRLGDLGIGFSTSSSAQFPGLAYTGQTPAEAGSTPNKLEQAVGLNIGAGSQTTVSRWGDYSSISVDPSNDCTFWYATEYLKSTGSYTNWGTYIVSFQFPGCQ